MKVFTCTDFLGHWPTGTAAVVVASNKEDARKHLLKKLTANGLGYQPNGFTLIELNCSVQYVRILNDGDY